MRNINRPHRPVIRRLSTALEKTNDMTLRVKLLCVRAYYSMPHLTVVDIAASHGVNPCSIYLWVKRFEQDEVDGLTDARSHRLKSYRHLFIQLLLPVMMTWSPSLFGLPTSQWTSGRLAQVLLKTFKIVCSASMVRRILNEIRWRWRRCRPAPKPNPQRAQALQELKDRLESLPAKTEVLFGDEVDIHLNPKIGFGWMPEGQQREVLTPGTNQGLRPACLGSLLHASNPLGKSLPLLFWAHLPATVLTAETRRHTPIPLIHLVKPEHYPQRNPFTPPA